MPDQSFLGFYFNDVPADHAVTVPYWFLILLALLAFWDERQTPANGPGALTSSRRAKLRRMQG